MELQVIWSPASVADVEGIHQYIAADDREAARKVCESIAESVSLLSRLPFLGPVYKTRRGLPAVREIQSGQYRIFYRVFEDRSVVEILHVRHGRRSEPGHL
jgi:plasmid stabilization system protein ParE